MLKLKLLWPPDTNSWLIWKDPDAGKDWGQEEKGTRGWDGWMASPTRCTWVWVNSGSWWWTGRPGVLRFMGSQRIRHNWATELNWIERPFAKTWARYRETTGRVQHQGIMSGWLLSPVPLGLQPRGDRAATTFYMLPDSSHSLGSQDPGSSPDPTGMSLTSLPSHFNLIFPRAKLSRNQTAVKPVTIAHSGQCFRHRAGWRVNLEGPCALFLLSSTTILWGKYYYYLHYTAEKTEAQRETIYTFETSNFVKVYNLDSLEWDVKLLLLIFKIR